MRGDILYLHRLEVDVDIVLQIRSVERHRNLRRSAANPRMQRHIVLRHGNQRRALGLLRLVIADDEETEHLVVPRNGVGVPLQ